MSIELSFLISTNRDPNRYVGQIIDNINGFNFKEYEYEICIFSPTEIGGRNVVWFKEDKPSGGGIYGINYTAQRCRGKYMAVITDDMLVDRNIFGIAHQFYNERTWEGRKMKVFGFGSGSHVSCWVPNTSNPTEYGCPPQLVGPKDRNYQNAYRILCFPALEHETLTKYLDNHIFHPNFKHHFGDNWLGLWLGLQGEKALTVPGIPLYDNNPQTDFHNTAHDYTVFDQLVQEYFDGQRKYIDL